MATALRIPKEALAQTITIDSALTPTPQGALLPADTPVQFTNNSGSTINITFNANPPAVGNNPAGPTMFTNITNLANSQTSAPQTPNPTTGSVNYTISAVGGGSNGPFAIQEGNGAIVVIVSYIANAVQYTPPQVAVPQDGNIQVTNNDGNTYNIGWTSGDPLNPPLSVVGGPGGNPVSEATGNPGNYPFGATKAGPVAAGGGGKVIVVSN